MPRLLDLYDDRSAWIRRAACALTVVVMTALSIAATVLVTSPMKQAYFFALFPAVAGSALLGGVACGLATAVAAVAAFSWQFLDPVHSLWVAGSPSQYRVFFLLCSAALVAALGGGFRMAYRRANEARHRAEVAEHEARELAETQERLTAVLGHDLRTPLSAIRLATEMLRRGGTSPAQARNLDRIASSADRMTKLIQDLLDVARARQGLGLAATREIVRLDELCARALDEIGHAHPGRLVQLDVREPLEVYGDPSRLHQVLTNLLANAVQHGSSRAAVAVAAQRDPEDGARALVRVHNAGEPIPPELLPGLFDPFRRLPGSADGSADDGLGLGLFIVHEIVKAHGGTVSVASSAQEGTTFSVVLPLLDAPDAISAESGTSAG